MNERQRLLHALRREPTDRLPWYADLSWFYSSMQERGTLESRFQGEEGYLRFHQEAGAGIYLYAPLVFKEQYENGYSFASETKSGVRTEFWHTPERTLRSVWKHLPQTNTFACVEHFVKSIEDFAAMAGICENTRYEENFQEFSRLDRLWGDDGLAFSIAPISVSPLQSLLARWAGVEQTVELCYDEEEEMEELIGRIQRAQDPVFDLLCEAPGPIVEFAENLSGEVTGKTLFERWNLPYYKQRTAQLHRAGKLVGIHNDGTLSPCFQMLETCGFDFIEAVTPAPVGDIPLEKLRENAGQQVVIFGGLPGALFSPVYSDKDFEEHLEKAIRQFSRPGYVLGVADQVPPDGIWERVTAVRERLGR